MFVTDNVIRENKKFYPQKLLEECQYKIKGLKWRTLLMMIWTSSSSSDESDSEFDNGPVN